MSLPLPGQPGSQNPAGPDFLVRENRTLKQQVEQLRGQLSRAQAAANEGVTNVTVAGSTLTVTFGDGSTHAYQLP